MCGVFGYIGAIPEAKARACLDTLIHRGPDGWGMWATAHITLGHRRLSILDLSQNGKQPMSYANGRYHITFNGEIYNFLEVRKELRSLGHTFRSDSDTEVILAAFSEWGEDCQRRFNGMWSFAIWDEDEKALFLSRDRFGKKPLFYSQFPKGEFAFASEMKALNPLLDSVKPNESLIRDPGRLFSYEQTSESLILGIQRFPAGHSGWFREGRLSLKRWWCTLDNLVDVPGRYEDQVASFRELFLDACRLRMRSDVPIGTALSGGLDSSATISSVAHVARFMQTERTSAGWQHAFVASFPDTPLDETVYARKVCEHIGIPAVVVTVDPAAAVSRLSRYFYLFEEIYITSPIPFMLTYEAIKRHGISVTLDGHGADELFGGYGFDFLVAVRDAGLDLRAGRQVVDAYFDSLPADQDQFPLPRSRLWFWANRQAKELLKALIGYADPLSSSRDSSHPAWGRLDNLTRRLYASTHETILPTLLRNYDRYSMANGVEIRMPFLDHRLVCFAFSLPWHAKVRNGFSKAIVRDAMAPFMPREIAYRKTKIGFNSPIVDWMRGPLREFMLDAISSRSFRECSLIDSGKVADVVRKVVDGESKEFLAGQEAWTLISPYLWEQAMFHDHMVAA